MNAEDATHGETNLLWRTSSHSTGSGGECVEVALTAVAVHVRDSKCVAQSGPALLVGSVAWTAMLRAI
ncbi:DUF397 domain-containing protein [Streptomyces hirsutus]|uniref:DUF397 domain-containing protein n=1 Tax=Streptomyces hirsutus TaxID=35620 RepID=UPI00340B4DBB